MGAASLRFVSKAQPGKGWRIWDRMQKKWWGEVFPSQPTELLAELNICKRRGDIVRLAKATIRKRK